MIRAQVVRLPTVSEQLADMDDERAQAMAECKRELLAPSEGACLLMAEEQQRTK